MPEQIRYFRKRILQINENNFDEIALEIFRYQAAANPVYAAYIGNLGVHPDNIDCFADIPFLPIRFFRSHDVRSDLWSASKVFRSSGTTGMVTSVHALDDTGFYHNHARRIFENEFGPLQGTSLIAVLPSYTERGDSSLVSMVDHFIGCTGSTFSGFFNAEPELVTDRLRLARAAGTPVILIGVTFALIDLVAAGVDLTGVTVIETGGMKGRKKEIIREELHAILRKSNPVRICSEYGMTELLSQAYAKDGKVFQSPPCMRVAFREVNDPFSGLYFHGQGVIMVADLANIHSCCFIETQDLGRGNSSKFEVLGRIDHSDVRGCSLLTA